MNKIKLNPNDWKIYLKNTNSKIFNTIDQLKEFLLNLLEKYPNDKYRIKYDLSLINNKYWLIYYIIKY